MTWKPYNENELIEPRKITWLFWVCVALMILLACFIGEKYWPGGWDGHAATFWTDVSYFLLGIAMLLFTLRLMIFFYKKRNMNFGKKNALVSMRSGKHGLTDILFVWRASRNSLDKLILGLGSIIENS